MIFPDLKKIFFQFSKMRQDIVIIFITIFYDFLLFVYVLFIIIVYWLLKRSRYELFGDGKHCSYLTLNDDGKMIFI